MFIIGIHLKPDLFYVYFSIKGFNKLKKEDKEMVESKLGKGEK